MAVFHSLFHRPVTLFTISIIFLYSSAQANWLEITLDKYDTGSEVYRYLITFGASKSGADSCELTTPLGTFIGIEMGGNCKMNQSFHDNHSNLTFTELNAIISPNWTLIWDKGLPTQTIATIGIGSISKDEWHAVPLITNPLNGSSNIPPDTTIDWSYNVPTEEAQKKYVEVILNGPSNLRYSSDELPLSTTSWKPPSALGAGLWSALVINGKEDYKMVWQGIGGPIVGDPWNLENGDWLALFSIDRSEFTVHDFTTWTGAVDSDWGKPGNWSGGEVPGDGADVYIPGDCPPAIHSATSGQSIIDQLSCSGQLTISGGSLTIDGDSEKE